MLVLRLLLLFAFMGTNVSSFASTCTLSDTQSHTYKRGDMGSYEDCNPVLYIPELKTESFPHHDTRLMPKVVYTLRHAKSAILTGKQLGVSFQYLKYCYTIDLKLASHSISYPFHSFP